MSKTFIKKKEKNKKRRKPQVHPLQVPHHPHPSLAHVIRSISSRQLWKGVLGSPQMQVQGWGGFLGL